MNQTLDKQAILDHYHGELKASQEPEQYRKLSDVIRSREPDVFGPIVFAAISQDRRVIDLVAQFNASDERGRVTLLRLAMAMPKNDSTKEICR